MHFQGPGLTLQVLACFGKLGLPEETWAVFQRVRDRKWLDTAHMNYILPTLFLGYVRRCTCDTASRPS